ncbi:N-acetylglucosaminyltransferase [Physocladia obscura]|uniref:N-acetylglucosaminyltransferase n=1 Tax=Physocladia obscura TaxID=109957 RepID=A0AAD5T1H5_9FUNG|nr:N-acetylglucosaminyltransferase [Physocladia obscura]
MEKLPSNIQLNILRMIGPRPSPNPNSNPSPADFAEKLADKDDQYSREIGLFQRFGFATIQQFLAPEAALTALHVFSSNHDALRPARIGTGVLKTFDPNVRNDRIRFIDIFPTVTASVNSEEQKTVAAVYHALNPVISAINAALNLDSNDCLVSNGIFQLGFYSNGARYQKHRDSSPFMPGRLVTLIIYLTQDWNMTKGGQLRLYRQTTHGHIDIAPLFNRLLIFKSHYDHEVLPAFCDRFALTMWLYSESLKAVEAVCAPTFSTIRSQIKTAQWSIFVSIASYRDPDAYSTVEHLIKTAKYPERLIIAVLHQDDPVEDAQLHAKKNDAILSIACIFINTIDRKDATGPYAARRKIAREMKNNSATHYFQIDSHMRFANNWDCILVELLDVAESVSKKSAISFYPPGFDDKNFTQLEIFQLPPPPFGPVLMKANPVLDVDGMVRVTGSLVFPPPNPETHLDGVVEPQSLIRQRFIAAGLLFSRPEIMNDLYNLADDDVESNLDGLFFGEECLCTAKLWTRGYEIWGPRDPNLGVAFHRWSRVGRSTFWENFDGESGNLLKNKRARSQACVKFVLGLQSFVPSTAEETVGLFQNWAAGKSNGVGVERIKNDSLVAFPVSSAFTQISTSSTTVATTKITSTATIGIATTVYVTATSSSIADTSSVASSDVWTPSSGSILMFLV